MLKRVIKNIRQQPKAVRDNIALGCAGIFTALITVIWLANMPARFTTTEDVLLSTEESSNFSNLFSNLKEQFAAAGESLSGQDLATSTSSTLATGEVEAEKQNIPVSDWALQEPSSQQTENQRLIFTTSTTTLATTSTSTVANLTPSVASSSESEVAQEVRDLTIKTSEATITATTSVKSR